MASQYTINKIIAGMARFASSILSPLLMPTYGTILVLWTSVLCALPSGTRITVVIVMMGITCVLPMIAISALHYLGVVHDKRLNNARERRWPYVITILCYAAGAYYLQYIHSPQWFTMFGVGALLALLVVALINLSWKISAHAAGAGGVVALVYQIHVQGLSAFELFWVLCMVILLAGVVGTARLILKCHSLAQVLAGFAVGYVCVTLCIKLWG